MENSYKRLARLRDETIYQTKKAIEARRMHQITSKQKKKEGISDQTIYAFENLQNAITLNELLDALVKLYEIE